MEAMTLPALPVAKSDRGDGGDMGRTIQGLEDLHHGFPVDRVGQRHHGFAFETVTGTPAIDLGILKGVLLPLLMLTQWHSAFWASAQHSWMAFPRGCSQQSLSSARRNHNLPPCVDAIDEVLPIDSLALTTTTLATEPSPLRQEQNFLANDWKKKRRLKGAFLTVLRYRWERR